MGGGGSAEGQATAALAETDALEHHHMHTWFLVGRAACRKGCCGPVLRAIQRFGRLGKRQWTGNASVPDLTDKTNNNMKVSSCLAARLPARLPAALPPS